MLLRLALSVCVAARAAGRAARRTSTSASARGRFAPRCRRSPRFIRASPTTRFRDACGLPPVPHAPAHRRVAARATASAIAPLTGHDLRTTPVAPARLSAPAARSCRATRPTTPPADVTSPRVRRDARRGTGPPSAPAATTRRASSTRRRLRRWSRDATSAARSTSGSTSRCRPGRPLYAPLDGVVHGFEDADAHHRLRPGDRPAARDHRRGAARFYTLYGHLIARVARRAARRQAHQRRASAFARDRRAARPTATGGRTCTCR